MWAPIAFSLPEYDQARESGRVFNYHFALTRQPMETQGEFHTRSFADFTLYTGAQLDCHLASNDAGLSVFVLGVAVDSDGHVIDDPRLRQILARYPDLDQLATYLCGAAGRYVFCIDDGTRSRLYLDPVGMLAATVNPIQETVASLAILAAPAPLEPQDDYPLWDAAAHGAGARFSYGFTADRRVSQLLPNHYLDLKTWKSHRHWPNDDMDFSCASLDQARERTQAVYDRHVAVITALVERFPTSLPVSGGQDSRLLLAFAQGCHDKIDNIFTHVTNYNTSRDYEVAQQLCEKTGTHHNCYEIRGNIRQYRPRIGIPNIQRRRLLQKGVIQSEGEIEIPRMLKREIAAAEAVPAGHLVLRGHVSDISKAVLWRNLGLRHAATTPDQPVPAEIATKLMQLMPNTMAIQAPEKFDTFYADWLATLPANTHGRSVDLMGIEQYRPYSLGGAFYASDRNFYMSPGNDRQIIAHLISLPPAFRASLHANDLLLSHAQIDLGDIPYMREADNEIRRTRPKPSAFFA